MANSQFFTTISHPQKIKAAHLYFYFYVLKPQNNLGPPIIFMSYKYTSAYAMMIDFDSFFDTSQPQTKQSFCSLSTARFPRISYLYMCVDSTWPLVQLDRPKCQSIDPRAFLDLKLQAISNSITVTVYIYSVTDTD